MSFYKEDKTSTIYNCNNQIAQMRVRLVIPFMVAFCTLCLALIFSIASKVKVASSTEYDSELDLDEIQKKIENLSHDVENSLNSGIDLKLQ